jgi:nucleotide-binding universal stress UspA family protein
MGKILCSTRGGEASYRAQDAAIALAKERGDTLIFLYVVDLHFLDKMRRAAIVPVEQEVTKMGQFLLLMAQERAAEQGVTAETICREGDFRPELENTAREESVSLIVLGRPADGESMFKLTALQTFAAELERKTGIETRII